jgi:type 1 fimbria pilin
MLSESEGGETGCSAFQAYGRQQNVATLTFGDLSQTQLDSQGVVTRYTDDTTSPIRVQVMPTNAEAQFVKSGGPGYITVDYNQLQYPIDFAAKGQFDFSASLIGLKNASSGAFSGTLTLTVIYR